MNLKFIVNDYILIWNILFQASISEDIHKLKQKIWNNYKNEYNQTFRDNVKILKDPKNFIPDNDTVYNIVLENKNYERIKKQTEKYRMHLLSIWDEHKRKTIKDIKEILRFDISDYCCFVVLPELDVIDTTTVENSHINSIVLGKPIDKNQLNSIIKLVFEIVKKEMSDYKTEYKDIVDAVIELAIINEFATRFTGVSYYLAGNNSLKFLKKQIYPYWLMYLGVEKDKMIDYMNRDNVAFNVDNYTYERQLKKINLYGFIDFCIKNQRHILKIQDLEIL